MTDDLQATIQRWLSLYTELEPSNEMPDWSELMQSLQHTGWQQLPDQHAELLAVMTQESIEFTRFAGHLVHQHQTQEQPELASFFKDFHQHINRLSDDLIVKRWIIPEQLGTLLKTRMWDNSSPFELPWLKAMNGLVENTALELPFNQQSAFREMTQLLHEHQQAVQDYTEHYARINTHALNQLSETIEASEQHISSLRKLHTLWVNAYETSYAERITTKEYQVAHGRISNTFMRLKLWLQEQRNTYLTQMGIATETSLNLAFAKIHTLSKQVRHLESLQQQTTSLHQEIQALKESVLEKRDGN